MTLSNSLPIGKTPIFKIIGRHRKPRWFIKKNFQKIPNIVFVEWEVSFKYTGICNSTNENYNLPVLCGTVSVVYWVKTYICREVIPLYWH